MRKSWRIQNEFQRQCVANVIRCFTTILIGWQRRESLLWTNSKHSTKYVRVIQKDHTSANWNRVIKTSRNHQPIETIFYTKHIRGRHTSRAVPESDIDIWQAFVWSNQRFEQQSNFVQAISFGPGAKTCTENVKRSSSSCQKRRSGLTWESTSLYILLQCSLGRRLRKCIHLRSSPCLLIRVSSLTFRQLKRERISLRRMRCRRWLMIMYRSL